MAGYKEVFPNPHAVLPVIHVETSSQALRNAEVAKKEGADGVFLISMDGLPYSEVAKMQETVKSEFSTFWVGVNYLNVSVVHVFENLTPRISGVWTDESIINEWTDQQIKAEKVRLARNNSGWDGLYFGSVAFKYQPGVTNVEKAAQIATKYMDVVTTSGVGTGYAPDRDKIVRMKGAIGDFPLAIASGISPQNVHNYLENADCFLVATSILKPGSQDFDPSRLRDLIQNVRG